MSGDVLDYADLVARYEAGLVDNLRSFGFQTDYLDLWVPDENLSRSLLNLFDAAAEAGHKSLAVRISAEAAADLKLAKLTDQAASRGQVQFEANGGSVILRITDLHVAATPTRADRAAVSAQASAAARTSAVETAGRAEAALRQPTALSQPYASNLASATGNAPAVPVPPNVVHASAGIDGLVLEADINPADHVIRAMRATGARGRIACDLIAATTQLCQGLPILEAADHGAIRLEYLLRGDSARPCPGILVPETIESAFHFVSALLRAVLADYRQKSGFKSKTNTFDVMPGPAWMQASDAERRTLLQRAFAAGGFPAEDVIVVAIEYDVRVVVSLGGGLSGSPASVTADLERCVKKHADGRLELFLTEVKDSNKLRRLSEPKSSDPKNSAPKSKAS